MTRRPSTPCKQSNCPNLVPYGYKYCTTHKPLVQLDTKSTKERGYTSRWRSARSRFLKVNPPSQAPSENDFLKLLPRNASYLFNNEISYASLGIQDLVFIKIMNSLYQYEKSLDYPIPVANPLEIKFLEENR